MPFIYIFFLGLIVGSFVNVVIYRLPRAESTIGGRSRCPKCDKKLAWYDLIPIASFLLLGGHCRVCGNKISPVYPAVELYSAFMFLASYWLFASFGLAVWIFTIFILELFLMLAIIDSRHLVLPDSLLIVLFIGVVVWSFIQRLIEDGNNFRIFGISSLVGAGVLFTVFFLIWLLSRGRGLGFGDVKLAGIIGLIFGFWSGLAILYIAIVCGALLGLFLMLARGVNLKTKLPFGTFICASATFYMLGGNIVLNRLSDVFYTIPFIFR